MILRLILALSLMFPQGQAVSPKTTVFSGTTMFGGNTASFTLVQHNSQQDNTTAASATFSGLTSMPGGVGTAIIVGVGNTTFNNAVSSVTDNGSGGGNTYTQATSAKCQNSTGNFQGDIWYVLNPTHGSVTSVTVNWGSSESFHFIFVYYVTKSSGSISFDTAANTSNVTGSGTDNTGAAVTTSAKGFILGLDIPFSNVTVSPKSGNEFTSGSEILTDGPATASLNNSSAATHTPVWTNSASGDQFCGSTAAFK